MESKLFESTLDVKLIRYKDKCGLLLDSNKLTIIHLHGLGGNFYENPFIFSFINSCGKRGYSFVSINSSTHDEDDDFYTEVEDLKELIDSYDKVILQGHSYGCIKVAYYIYKFKPKNVIGTVLLSPTDMKWLFEKYVKLKDVKDDELYKIYFDEPYYLKGEVIRKLFLEDNFHRYFYEENIPNKVLENLPNALCVFGKEDFCVRDVNEYSRKLEKSGIKTKIIDGDHIFSGNEEKLVQVVLEHIQKII